MQIAKTKIEKKAVVATFSAVFFLFSFGIFYPFLSPYLVSEGFTKSQISFVFSLPPLFIVFSSAILGRVADVIGRKKVMMYSILMLALSLYAYLLLPKGNLLFLALISVISMVAYHSFNQTAIERVQDNFTDGSRGFFTGLFETLRSVGYLSGTLLGTLIISIMPIPNAIKITIGALALLFVLGIFTKNQNHNKIAKKDLNPFTEIKEFLQIKELRSMALLGMATNFTQGATTIFVPLLLTQELKANVGMAGIFAAVLSVSHLSQFLFGRSCDLHGENKIMIRSTISYGLSMLLFFFAPNSATVMLIGAFLGLASAAWNTSAWCYMSRIGEKIGKEGLVIGTYTSFAFMGATMGYVATGYLSALLGTRYVFLLYSVVVVSASLVALRNIKKSAVLQKA